MEQDLNNLDFLKDVLDDYIVETSELLEQAEHDLLALEEEPGSPDLLNRIFRAFHTIKGTSSFLGFERMAELTHRAEDVLNLLRHGELVIDQSGMDVLLQVVDTARTILENIRNDGNEGEVSVETVLRALDGILHGKGAEQKTEQQEGADEEKSAEKPAPQRDPAAQQVADSGSTESQKHDSADDSPGKAQKQHEQTASPAGKAQTTQTVRVNVSRLDEMMDLVGELVLVRNRIQQLVQGMRHGWSGASEAREAAGVGLEQLTAASEQLHFISAQLQDAVMRVRMLPISNVFHRFPRLVRDLAKEKGKEAKLVLEGEDTELDKSVLELISDPLVHLIRNSIDHGIEPPDEREKAGKPRAGTVRLAARHEGDHIVIEVEDDGRGIDPEKVKQAAIRRGLLPEEEVRKLNDREALDLIFLPGFSTKETVTETSGRGVGMDVVKTNITRLNGQISLESTPGRGTCFIVRLPLTLVIVPGLLVEVAGQVLVLPLSSVLETARVRDHRVYTLGKGLVLRLREEVVPLIDLADVLGIRRRRDRDEDEGYAVIVGLANKRAGILIDRLRGQEEIVVKPLGGFLGNAKIFAGGTILGDGKVRLVLDVGELLEAAQQQVAAAREAQPANAMAAA